jgi:hypothetical protein
MIIKKIKIIEITIEILFGNSMIEKGNRSNPLATNSTYFKLPHAKYKIGVKINPKIPNIITTSITGNINIFAKIVYGDRVLKKYIVIGNVVKVQAKVV